MEEMTEEELNFEIERENLLNFAIALSVFGLVFSIITIFELFGFFG